MTAAAPAGPTAAAAAAAGGPAAGGPAAAAAATTAPAAAASWLCLAVWCLVLCCWVACMVGLIALSRMLHLYSCVAVLASNQPMPDTVILPCHVQLCYA